MKNGLVSIIIVCYNGEKYINRSFDSILQQTYNQIEIIFINDGSTDKTEEKVKEYEEKIKERGYTIKYLSKKNEGQAAALNEGIKMWSGEFLAFLDVDDEIEKTSIEKRVEYLKQNPQYGLVRTRGKIIDEETNEIIGHIKHYGKEIKTDIYEDLIMEKDIWVSNGCYMIRYDAFTDSIPEKEIYVHRGGQNWQILLPIAKKYQCGYIDEELFIYHLIKDSHSHKGESFEEEYNKSCGHEEILTAVLKRIGDYELYKSRLIEKYARKKMEIARKYRKKDILKQEMLKLKANKTYTIKDRAKFYLGMFGV